MNRNKGIQIGLILVALVASIFLGQWTDKSQNTAVSALETLEVETNVIGQAVIGTLSSPTKVKKLYDKDQLIGVIKNQRNVELLLQAVYENEYKDEFPDTTLGFIDDIYMVEELTYSEYEDMDQEIFDYVYEEDRIAIQVPKIEFSNGATIYVKQVSDFNKAREMFIKSYISEDAYNRLINNEKVPPLKTYGEQEVDFSVNESIVISKGYASIDNIYLNDVEVLNFLSFGDEPEYKTYEVQEFDMIEGIAMLNALSVNQLMSMNSDKISSEQQILAPGLELNVTEFNSPLNVVVTKERMVEEVIHPEDTIYRNDPSLREGLTRVEVYEEKGLRDVVYEDIYVNDEPIESNLISSKTTKEPVRGVVLVGTYEEPRVGSGNFAWPMNNARIICGWYCYAGHAAVDVASRSNRGYGPVYASDRGYVASRGYDGSRGYYVVINHNNGFSTHYYHLNAPGYVPLGVTVRKGEQIGYVGMTGRTNAPHVHFEIRYNGTKVHPCKYIGC